MFHQITAIGHVGNISPLRYTPSGKAVANFSLAVNEKFGDKQRTTWYTITLWNGRTKLLDNITQGDRLFVQGRPELGSFDKQNGETVPTLTIHADTIRFMGNNRPADEEAEPTETDDIPF